MSGADIADGPEGAVGSDGSALGFGGGGRSGGARPRVTMALGSVGCLGSGLLGLWPNLPASPPARGWALTILFGAGRVPSGLFSALFLLSPGREDVWIEGELFSGKPNGEIESFC